MINGMNQKNISVNSVNSVTNTNAKANEMMAYIGFDLLSTLHTKKYWKKLCNVIFFEKTKIYHSVAWIKELYFRGNFFNKTLVDLNGFFSMT